MSEIHAFALEWLDKFKNKEMTYEEMCDGHLKNDCMRLGFNNVDEEAIKDSYYRVTSVDCKPQQIIESVDDPEILGAIIYTKLRSFNQTQTSCSDVIKTSDRQWFIYMFERLEVVSCKKLGLFTGLLKTCKLISNNICYGPTPGPNDEVEQRLTITRSGKVWFSAYALDDDLNRYKKIRSDYMKIDKSVANVLLDNIEVHFSRNNPAVFVTDVGVWEMELINTEGVKYQFSGSLISDIVDDGVNLSELIRYHLNREDLFAFDGHV